jgi:hypothetical protein
VATCTPNPEPEELRAYRTRALPFRGAFISAVALSAIHYLGLIALLTCIVLFARFPSIPARNAVVLSTAFTGITWGIAYLRRRSAYCPLCKGTPLLSTGARPHRKAVRIKPLSHGVTAILSAIATQQFRCMYCGSHFDMLKVPSHRRGRHDDLEEESSDDPNCG